MGRTEKAGDAVNLLNFAGPRSLAELRGARADGIKNIDSISSLEPESKKHLKEAELPGYDVSISFEGSKTFSILRLKKRCLSLKIEQCWLLATTEKKRMK
ncbi:hypothetical protein HPP92_008245 [Vanilla planifolia]|uniref:Uncharacterized protein n=1 Tax=Vanilla planifolia TaxID=51239 RepID=A0A835RDR5_VANPL|nr:hypothetical protein HPP92_008245 [Vanilla planifolia]